MKKEENVVETNINNNKKKGGKVVKGVIVSLTTILLASGACIYINKDTIFKKEVEKADIYKNIEFVEELKLEAGQDIDINKFIKRVVGGELIVDNAAISAIDTKILGDTIIKLSVKDANGDVQDFELKINIKDTVKPEITVKKEKIEITAGDKVDLLEGVSAKDNIDEKIEVKIEGKYDTKKEGKYKLKYVAEDKSGNKTEKAFTLVVKEKEEKNTTTNNNTANKNNSSTNSNTNKNTTTNKNNTSNKNTTTNKNNTSNNKNNTTTSGSYQSAKALLSSVNSVRKSAGVGNLSWSSSLESAAKTRAKELAKSYSHTRPNGSAFYTVNANVYAENIANGYTSASSVHNAWKASSGHYNNMINKKYKTMGAACYVSNGTYYWVEVFGY